MNTYIKFSIFIISLLGNVSLFGTDFIITDPGMYVLGVNILYTGTGSDSAVIINSNDVVFDLNNLIILQPNVATSVDGIIVNSNLSNVTIRNGTIRNFSRKGIVVNQGCSKVSISNITVENCLVGGIEFIGTLANPVEDSEIIGCDMINCCTASPSDIVLSLTQCFNIQVNDCNISSCGVASRPISCVRFVSTTDCNASGINVVNCTGLTTTGFDLVAPINCTFTNCIVRDSGAVSVSGGMRGFGLSGNANNANKFDGCMVLTCSSAGTSRGFDIAANSNNNIFLNCTVNGNTATGGDLSGFSFGGGNNINNSLINCIANSNSATGAVNDSYGFIVGFAGTSNFGTMVNCIGSYNTSAAAIAAGLLFGSANGSTSTAWSIQGCVFVRNVGSSPANSFGISGATTNGHLFFKNVAFNNNTTQANQLQAVPANSQATIGSPQTNNINGVAGPWTNVPVAT